MNSLVTTTRFPKEVGDLFNQFFNGQDLFPISRQEGYPHYNAWADADGTHKIEIAVAGFSKDEIAVDFDGRTLSITGEKKETTEDTDRRWLYRGLAKRKFVRQFDVRGSFTIESAILKNGVLTISLKDETRKAVIEVQED
jgi:molecular chaperone IbpA